MSDAPTLNAVVTLRNQVSPWLMVLQVVPDGWDFAEFVAGQSTLLGLFGSASRCDLAEAERAPVPPDSLIRRPYCIASSPANREFLEFYIALVPGGVLTPRLFNLKIGDRIWLSPKAVGSFTFDHVPDDANVVLLATGSGLAPYVSMLSTHLKFASQRRVMVLHGVRHSWDLGDRAILMTMQHLRTNFSYLPVVSRPQHEPVPWKGATGHVQNLWRCGRVEQAWGLRPKPENTHVFLCGSPDMIDAMVSMLVEDGFAEAQKNEAGQIHAARYWQKKTN
jgi:ferredoxin/flavodoxin---NADP+ reductase